MGPVCTIMAKVLATVACWFVSWTCFQHIHSLSDDTLHMAARVRWTPPELYRALLIAQERGGSAFRAPLVSLAEHTPIHQIKIPTLFHVIARAVCV